MKILYIMTNLMQQDAYGGYAHFWFDNMYSYAEKRGVEAAIREYGRSNVLIAPKWNPQYRMIPWLEEYRDRLVAEKHFDSRLRECEMVFTAWPTTTIFKALKLGKPVVVLVKDFLGLTEEMVRYIEQQPMWFMRDYAIHINDGKCVERVVDEVMKVINGQKSSSTNTD